MQLQTRKARCCWIPAFLAHVIACGEIFQALAIEMSCSRSNFWTPALTVSSDGNRRPGNYFFELGTHVKARKVQDGAVPQIQVSAYTTDHLAIAGQPW
jgi:hypothetical protein